VTAPVSDAASYRERGAPTLPNISRYGMVHFRPLFTHQKKLGELPAGYDMFRPRKDGVVKIAIRP
jgi:threonine dehydrogenase-like Zn-dependent dehydrogenase